MTPTHLDTLTRILTAFRDALVFVGFLGACWAGATSLALAVAS